MTILPKKQCLLSAFLFVVTLSTFAADGLVVYFKNGTAPMKFQLISHRPKISFSDESLRIDDSRSRITLLTDIAYKDIKCIAYEEVGNDEETDIHDFDTPVSPKTSTFRFLAGDDVAVDGASPDATVRLVSVNGGIVQTNVDRSNDVLVIHLGHLPRGIYLLQVDQQTFKLLKK